MLYSPSGRIDGNYITLGEGFALIGTGDDEMEEFDMYHIFPGRGRIRFISCSRKIEMNITLPNLKWERIRCLEGEIQKQPEDPPSVRDEKKRLANVGIEKYHEPLGIILPLLDSRYLCGVSGRSLMFVVQVKGDTISFEEEMVIEDNYHQSTHLHDGRAIFLVNNPREGSGFSIYTRGEKSLPFFPSGVPFSNMEEMIEIPSLPEDEEEAMRHLNANIPTFPIDLYSLITSYLAVPLSL